MRSEGANSCSIGGRGIWFFSIFCGRKVRFEDAVTVVSFSPRRFLLRIPLTCQPGFSFLRRDGASVLDIPTPLGKVGVLTTATNRSQRTRKTFRQFVAGDRTLSSEIVKVRRFLGVDFSLRFFLLPRWMFIFLE